MSPQEHGGRSADGFDEPAAPGSGRGPARESAICDAALELLAEVGYDRMSMDAVAARARASKATIYRRWPGKRELVLDAVRSRGPRHSGAARGHREPAWRHHRPTAGTVAGRHRPAEDVALMAGVLRAMRSAPELADSRAHAADRGQVRRRPRPSCAARSRAASSARPTDPDLLHEVARPCGSSACSLSGDPVDDDFLTHVADDVLIPLLASRRPGNRSFRYTGDTVSSPLLPSDRDSRPGIVRRRRPPALARARRHRRRPAHGRARRLDREHRAAVGPARPRHHRRRPAVDRHRLHAGLRRPAAARRPHRRLRRAASGRSSSACSASPAPPRSAARAQRRSCCSRPAPCRARSPRCWRRPRCP